ncbi:DNA topoisomerase 2-binding protein 1 [Irineochytrium annulatum]|nr:DNA topoisomerase 2-binding protein 1 [Irineochytrium annulatum]
MLKGARICSTNLATQDKDEVQKLAKFLGATFTPNLTTDTTHLIANSTSSEKYKVDAQDLELNIPVIGIGWLRECWKHSNNAADVKPNALLEQHRLKSSSCVTAKDTQAVPNQTELDWRHEAGHKPGLFFGLTFAAVGFNTDENEGIKQEIERRKGQFVSIRELHGREKSRCYVVVPLTCCIEEGRILPIDGEIVYQPLRSDLPLPEFRFLLIGISGFEDIPRAHIQKLSISLGAQFTEAFSKKNTHLVLSRNNKDSIKAKKAKDWHVPVVCVQWLYACAAEKRIEMTRIATALGAKILSTYSEACTHYVFESSKVNEMFKEFKEARRTSKYIISPAWIYKCQEANNRVNEADFPHNYNPSKSLNVATSQAKPLRRPTKPDSRSSTTTSPSRVACVNDHITLTERNIDNNTFHAAANEKGVVSVVGGKPTHVDKYAAAVDQLLVAAQKKDTSVIDISISKDKGGQKTNVDKYVAAVNQLLDAAGKNPCEPSNERSVFDNEILNDQTSVEITSAETALRDDLLIIYDDPDGRHEKRRLIETLTNKDVKRIKVEPPAPTVRTRTFLFTGVQEKEKVKYSAIIRDLGGIVVDSDHWEDGASHLIANVPARTEKCLAACACGAW